MAAKPPTLFVNKAASGGRRPISRITWGAAQAGVAAGVMQAVADGVIDRDKVDDLLLIAAVWVDAAERRRRAVYENNLAATQPRLAAGARGPNRRLDRGDRGSLPERSTLSSVRLRPIQRSKVGWPLVSSIPSTATVAASSEAAGRSDGPLVVARDLVKRFGDFVAVDHVDFEIAKGESFGFLGPNGAGKTSTMRMISCMSPLSEGSLASSGWTRRPTVPVSRGRIGLVPQEDSLDLELTVLDNLMIYGRYFDLPRKVITRARERLLDFAQLTDRAKDKVDPLSGGMKRRLTIARSLISGAGALDPRRTDDRSRPAGAAPAVGPALPAEATGRHLDHHDPLHGRGRAALRPSGGHGPRTIRRRGNAARADRALRDP